MANSSIQDAPKRPSIIKNSVNRQEEPEEEDTIIDEVEEDDAEQAEAKPSTSRDSKIKISLEDLSRALSNLTTMGKNPKLFLRRGNKKRVEKPKEIRLGPVRIVIIGSKGRYSKQILMSIANGLTQFMLGASNIVALGYTLDGGDLHAVLCTIGWHFFSAEAIVCLNYGNSWASSLKKHHKKLLHVVFQICGTMCSVLGVMLVMSQKDIEIDVHMITGMIAFGASFISLVFGPVALARRKRWKIVHLSIGLPSFVISSVSFVFGVLKPAFMSWAGDALSYVLVSMIVIYTLLILALCLYKWFNRLKYFKRRNR